MCTYVKVFGDVLRYYLDLTGWLPILSRLALPSLKIKKPDLPIKKPAFGAPKTDIRKIKDS